MNSRVEAREGVVIVQLDGDVDVSQALGLRDTLATAMGDGSGSVLLDLGGVDFIDSAGIGLLVTAHRRAQSANGALALAAVTPTVARVLELTRTDRVLRVVPTVEEGVEALRGPAGRASAAGAGPVEA